MQASTENVQLLMETALMAVGFGQYREAEKIFAAIQAVRPDSELPLVGRGVMLLNAGQHLDAIAWLQKAAEQNPDSELAVSFLGVALKLAGMNKAGDDVLQEVVRAGESTASVALADAMLQHATV